MSRMSRPQQQQQQLQTSIPSTNIRRKAYVKIIEQPASKALRFRYECEGRSAGSIPGINSTSKNKTFPAIEIVGYKGRAIVVVSCVTKNLPYRPHPHNLVSKESCKKGVCTVEVDNETMQAVFNNLGIQCVKRKDIENSLRAREEIRVDPFKTGFSHRFQPSSIDLNSVRLCFQVFLESEQKGRFTVPLPPVVSDPIYDKKTISDLVICTLSSCSSTVAGGKEIILLCEKVAKEDISIRFFEGCGNKIVWEAFGDFQHTDVHKQVAIKFRTPRYKTLDVEQPVKAFIQLRRLSNGATSEPLPFDYLPLDSDPAVLKRKRQRFDGEASMYLLRQFQPQEYQQQLQKHQQEIQSTSNSDGRNPEQEGLEYLKLNHSGAQVKSEIRYSLPLPNIMFDNATNCLLSSNSPYLQPAWSQNIYNNANNISTNMNIDMDSRNYQQPPLQEIEFGTATLGYQMHHQQQTYQWTTNSHNVNNSKYNNNNNNGNNTNNNLQSSSVNETASNLNSLLDIDSDQLIKCTSGELSRLCLS